jgi:hypothetical protein
LKTRFLTRQPLRFLMLRTALAISVVAGLIVGAMPFPRDLVAQNVSGLASYVPTGALVFGEVELDPESGQMTLARELLDQANIEALLTPDQQDELMAGLAMAGDMIDGQASFFFGPIDRGELGIDDVSSEAAAIANDPLSAAQELPGGWAILLQPGDPEYVHDFLVDSIGMQMPVSTAELPDDASSTPPVAAADSPVQSETYEGYDISYEPATEGSAGQALALVDDVIVAAASPDDVKTVIDVVTGTTESLATDTDFQDVRHRLPDQALALGYVDGPAWLDLIEAQESAEFDQIPDELLASFAVHQGFAVWADEPGFRLDSVALAPEGIAPSPLNEYQPTLANTVPADTMVYAGGADLGAYPQLEALAFVFALDLIGVDTETVTPPADPEAYADAVFAEAEEVLGFNLKTDVLDQLTGEWAVAGTTDLATGSAVFITEVADPDVVAEVLADVSAQLASQSGTDTRFELSTREVDGAEIMVLDITDAATPIVIEFGVVDGKLVVGLNGWLDLATAPAEDPLADDPTFQATLSALPAEYTTLSYVNLSALIPLVDLVMSTFASTSSTVDADPTCGEYTSQEEAQAAYDDDDFENYMLDLDWDGIACEDYFAEASPVATPAGIAEVNVLSIGTVTWVGNGVSGASAIVLIGD